MTTRRAFFSSLGAALAGVLGACPACRPGEHCGEILATRGAFRVIDAGDGLELWRMLGRNRGRENWRQVGELGPFSEAAALRAVRHCGRSIRRACGVWREER